MTLANVQIPWIDGARTRRIIELLFILWLLALSDLFFTIWAHIFTPFCELNPLADQLLQHNRIGWLVAAKVALTGFGSAIFWRLRRHRRVELALWVLVAVYVLLTLRWSGYTADALAIGPAMM
jgi:hypothetical protein